MDFNLSSEVSKAKKHTEGATTAAAGGAAGYGAYLGSGNATARLNDKVNIPKYNAQRKQNDKKVKAVKRSLNIPSDKKVRDYTTQEKNDFFRNYPQDVPGGKVKRVQSKIWGAQKYGRLKPAAVVTAAGASLAYGAHKVKKNDEQPQMRDYKGKFTSVRNLSFMPNEGLVAEINKSMPDASAMHVPQAISLKSKRKGKLKRLS